MRMIYGTGNPAKLQHMRDMLAPLPVEIAGIKEVLAEIPNIDESGNDPLENATLKATAYYEMLKVLVFSCDSGLYIEGLDAARQPGVHVRRVDGLTLDDEEAIAYYAALAKECGGFCRARYRNAICLMVDPQHIYTSMDDDLSGEAFLLSATPHPKRRAGFPLDSLSVEIASGKYYYDVQSTLGRTMDNGFLRFFGEVLREIRK